MVYSKDTSIGYSNIGKLGAIKIVSIMNFLQDAASEHASLMGVSGFDLAKENLGWVIFRYHIDIKSNPGWQESIAVRTDRFPCKNLYEIRDLSIVTKSDKGSSSDKDNESEREFVSARVCWVMINRKNGKPVRLSRFMDHKMEMDKSSCCNLRAEKNGATDDGLESYFSEVMKPEKVDHQLPFKVRMHDLDLNGHVNNAIYVEWGVETVPEEILSGFSPASIDVVFNRESLYGDTIVSQTEIKERSESPLTYHSIIRERDQIELARLNIVWRPLNIF